MKCMSSFGASICRFVLACAIGPLSWNHGHAAEITIGQPGEPMYKEPPLGADEEGLRFISKIDCNYILNGEISSGDAEKLKSLYYADHVAPLLRASRDPEEQSEHLPDEPNVLLEQVPKVRSQYSVTLCMNSGGRDYHAGLELGKAIAERSITTIALNECLSACALAFMFGRNSLVIGAPGRGSQFDRYVRHDARLAFHAPNLPVSDQVDMLPYSVFEEFYERAIRDMASAVEYSIAYGIEGVPVIPYDLLLQIAITPPNLFQDIDTVRELSKYGINVFGIEGKVVLNARSASAACDNVARKLDLHDQLGKELSFNDVQRRTIRDMSEYLKEKYNMDALGYFERRMMQDGRELDLFAQYSDHIDSDCVIVPPTIAVDFENSLVFDPLLFIPPDTLIEDLPDFVER